MKFSELKVGDRFLFNDIRAGRPQFNTTYGPFTKVSEKRYQCVDGVKAYVDTTTYEVVKK